MQSKNIFVFYKSSSTIISVFIKSVRSSVRREGACLSSMLFTSFDSGSVFNWLHSLFSNSITPKTVFTLPIIVE